MDIKGLLFDLDGVLVDTAKYHFIAWKELAEKLGINFTEADNERLKGVSRRRSFEIILEIGNREMGDEEAEKYCTEKNDVYVSYISRLTKDELLPGAFEFLQNARKAGYLIALGSASKNSRMILQRLEIEGLFDAVIDGTVVSRAKPDPEVFVAGAKALGLENCQCIVFEDAIAGIEAAHAAGMKAVGIGTRELLPEADLVVSDLSELRLEEILSRLSQQFSHSKGGF